MQGLANIQMKNNGNTQRLKILFASEEMVEESGNCVDFVEKIVLDQVTFLGGVSDYINRFKMVDFCRVCIFK